MITNEIVCCECECHVAWSDTGTLDNIYCDNCVQEENEKHNVDEQAHNRYLMCCVGAQRVAITIEVFLLGGNQRR